MSVDVRTLSPIATLVDGLAGSPHLVSLFDPGDRLCWCNAAFRAVFRVPAGEWPSWIELMRMGHRQGWGTQVQTLDFEAWLTSAASRRGKQAFRAFEADVQGGRWFWTTEQKLADGSLLCISCDITPLHTDARELRQARDLAQRQAVSDPLTGLGNRRHVMDVVAAALGQADRGEACLALIDLDHFKRINDGHGHHVGDRVLRAFARLLLSVMRRNDSSGRIGGEEFLAFLPHTGLQDALKVVQRLQSAVRASVAVPELPALRYTCSVGLVAVDRCSSVDELLARADKALYAAKAAGRDRCVVADAIA